MADQPLIMAIRQVARHTYTRTHTRARTHTHTRARARARTRTHTHTHYLYLLYNKYISLAKTFTLVNIQENLSKYIKVVLGQYPTTVSLLPRHKHANVGD